MLPEYHRHIVQYFPLSSVCPSRRSNRSLRGKRIPEAVSLSALPNRFTSNMSAHYYYIQLRVTHIHILSRKKPNNLRRALSGGARVVIATVSRFIFAVDAGRSSPRKFRVGGVFPRRRGRRAIRFPAEAGVETMNRPTGVLPANLQA